MTNGYTKHFKRILPKSFYNKARAASAGAVVAGGINKRSFQSNRKRVGVKPKMKIGQSYTRSKSKTGKDELLDTTQHNDLSHKSFAVTLRKKARLYKPLGDFQFVDSHQKLLTNPEGFQGITTYKALFTSSSFISASNLRNEDVLNPQTPFDLNPYQTNTGGGVLGSIVKPLPDFVHCKCVDGMMMIQNQGNVAMSVNLVWWICKKSTNLNPSDMWLYATQQKQLGQSAAGAVTQTTGATNSAGYTIPTQYGQSPTYEKIFNWYYRKLKGFNFDLQAGGTRKFNYRLNVNKTFSKSVQQQNVTAGNIYVAGQTIVPMIIMRPVMVNITDTLTKEATIAATELGMVETHHYRWTALAGGRLEYDRVFPGIIQGTVHTVGETMIDDIDTMTTVKQA